MTQLPTGWTTASLGEVAEWTSGGTPKAGTPAYYGGGVPWAVIGDLKDGLVTTTTASITEAGLANSSAKVVPAGTVLVAMYGSIGKLGIAGVDMATNQAIACARPLEVVTRDWLFWWLRYQRNDLLAAGKGGTQANISQTVLKAWPIPIAPQPEQVRIVAAIEEAFSLLDAGETALHNTRTHLKRMRASVLTAAVTGQLVPQDPMDTPADKLLAEVGVSSTADVGELPAVPPSWVWARLGELAEVVGGVTKDAKRQGDTGNVEVPYLRVANVQRGYLDLTAVATIRVPEAKAAQLALHPGDVLFNEGGDRDKLGRGWVWDGQIPGCIHQNHVYRARLADGIEPRFVSWWGNTFGRGWFEFHGKQTTNLASINLTTLKSFPVPFPPPEEQGRIVAEVERQFSFIEAAERAVDAGLARSKGLRRSVLKAAFEGRLVEQDPSDEPASVLLGRFSDRRTTESSKHGRRAVSAAS